MRYVLVLILLAVLAAVGCSSQVTPVPTVTARDFVYMTEEYPPHNFTEGGMLKGISVDLLELIFGKLEAGLTRQQVQVVPWTQGYQRALNEKNTVLFVMIRLPERESKFKWVGPIAPERIVVFSLAGKGLAVSSVSDLKKYRIGVVKDDRGEYLLTASGFDRAKMEVRENAASLIDSLRAGKIDAMVYGDMAAQWLARQLGGKPNELEIALVLSEDETYYAFNKETADDVVQAFQKALDRLKREKEPDGTSAYEKVIAMYTVPRYARDSFTREQVIKLVEQTAAEIAKDTAGTFRRITAGEPPYRDEREPALYVFVYDTSVNIVAHAYRPTMVGQNYQGQPDITGKKFRDEIVDGALKNGSGWVDYVTTKADESGLFYKVSYYRLVRGSDGRDYVACAGMFKNSP